MPYIFSSLNSTFPFKKKFHGFHLLACDGSDVNIPPKPGDSETYVASNTTGVGYHQMHLNDVYDLMEERYLDVVLQKRAEINERTAFVHMVDRNSLDSKCLYVADRGYFSLNVLAHIIRAEQFFLLRMNDLNSKSSFLRRFSLPSSREFDQMVSFEVTRKQSNIYKNHPDRFFVLRKDRPFDLIPIDHTRSQSMANCAYVHSDCTIHEYQFLKTMEDVELMTEYDVMEAFKRVRGEDETVMPQGVPDTWRYLPLFDYFGNCEKSKITLSFTEIEEILGFPLSPSQKSGKWAWYRRTGILSMADAWSYQGYKLKHLDFKEQKASFETIAEDLEKVIFPPELMDKKIPKKAKYEIEHYLQGIIKKYGLTTERFTPRK